jgi:SNF2 family DNA or RNA helicase
MDPYLGDFYSHPPVNFDTDTTDALDDMDAWGDVLRSTGWLEFDPATHEGSTVPMELDDDEEAEGDLGLNSMSLVDVPEAEDHIDSDSDSDGSSASDDIPDNGIPMALDVEDEQLLKQAHKLVQQGFSAEPWTASSKWSLKSTPRAFKNANKNTQFLPHQLSAAGWLMHSNLGGLLSYEMGLGKTFILIGAYP